MTDLNGVTRKFLMGEWKKNPSVRSYFKTIGNILENIRGGSQSEKLRISEAKHHLREMRKLVYKLEEKVQLLEEQVKVLEENKEKDIVDE